MEIEIGRKGVASTLAQREDTAAEVGSGDLLVYATPCMAALMEGAACDAIADCLAQGQTTVGTELNIRHTCATPVGLEVDAERRSPVEGKRGLPSPFRPMTRQAQSAAPSTPECWSMHKSSWRKPTKSCKEVILCKTMAP